MNNIEKITDRLYNDSEEAKWEKRYNKRKKYQKAGKIINGIDRALPELGKRSRHNKVQNKLSAEKALISGYNKLRKRVHENLYGPNTGQKIARGIMNFEDTLTKAAKKKKKR